MGMHEIKIKGAKDSFRIEECSIDGVKPRNITEADLHIVAGEVPRFEFKTIGMPDIELNGAVSFEFAPETVQEASIVLQNEFRTNSKSYKALVDSIASVLKELPSEEELWSVDVAEMIGKRIIGIE